MVRILSCHHFRGQRIGRCDEAIGVAVAGNAIIVALEHQVNIYGRITEQHGSPEGIYPDHKNLGTKTGIPGFSFREGGSYEIGTPFVYHKTTFEPAPERPRTTSGSSSVDSVDSDTELRLSHSFSTIDLIDSISYNDKGKYVLCLEKRETSANQSTTSVRVYFHWERNHELKPMRARIAGLVSPTGAEPEDDSLMMVEIPLTSPATAVTACNLSGNIACLSAESIINLFLFRAKEVTGRVKVNYYDFDRLYAIEMPGFVPEKIFFLTNYIACINSHKMQVFRIKKEDQSDGHHSFAEADLKPNTFSTASFFSGFSRSSVKNTLEFDNSEKVVFDPKNETVKVHLNSIIRANRKRRSPSALISEEFQDEITLHRSKLIFTTVHSSVYVEDILRISTTGTTNAGPQNHHRLIQVGMYPIRIKDNLGGISLLLATAREGFLYHLPVKGGSSVARVTTYPFTAPLVSFTFDSLFFHALTETGLESYTCRSLFHAVKESEELKNFKNDCPFPEEPSLVGIRPFLKVRRMACNTSCLCLLACSANQNKVVGGHGHLVQLSNEEWTIYTLELPDIDMIYEDIMRTAQLQTESNPESYFTLLCEGHILLRLYMNSHPESTFIFAQRYRETCKLIGLEYLKSSWLNPLSSVTSVSGSISAADAPATPSSNLPSISSSPPSDFSFSAFSSLNISEDLVDKGVTYLLMGKCDLQEIFSSEHNSWLREPRYVPGLVRLIEVTFSELQTSDGNMENQKLSPTLAPILVEFLANNGSHVLVDLVIRVSFLRECNSRRLINILQQMAESREYQSKETLALLLTLVTVGGVEHTTCNQVKDLLHKTKLHDLNDIIKREAILETRGKQCFLTDLAICFAASDSQNLVIEKVVSALNGAEISISDVMFAFAQAVNLNADTNLQHSITKCLTTILENYLSGKLKMQLGNVTNSMPLDFTEEEKRAVQTLVRTYLSHFNTPSNFVLKTQSLNPHQNINDIPLNSTITGCTSVQSNVADHHHLKNTVHHNSSSISNGTNNLAIGPTTSQTEVPSSVTKEEVFKTADLQPILPDSFQRYQLFGRIGSFVNFLLSINTPGGMLTPTSQSLATSSFFHNDESRESFIKLLSLLSSTYANVDGVKNIVLTYLNKNVTQMNSAMNSTLCTILQVVSETTDKSVNILLSKQPTTVMLFSKEMFGRTPLKWKILVTNLKKKIQANPDSTDADIFATILESAYLHLANTLSPGELEQVLDKETEESTKFHGICKRVELANTYANMVITVSSDYLSHK